MTTHVSAFIKSCDKT